MYVDNNVSQVAILIGEDINEEGKEQREPYHAMDDIYRRSHHFDVVVDAVRIIALYISTIFWEIWRFIADNAGRFVNTSTQYLHGNSRKGEYKVQDPGACLKVPKHITVLFGLLSLREDLLNAHFAELEAGPLFFVFFDPALIVIVGKYVIFRGLF